MSINTVIFDLDGTLLYTLEDLKDSTNKALAEYGFPSRTIDEIRNFVGNGVALLIERAIPNGKDNSSFDACLNFFKTEYLNNMYNKTKPYDGIIDMLKSLKAKGFNLAVVSNKFDDAVKELCDKYFGELIDISVGQKEGVRIKPYPDSVLEVFKLLNVTKEESIFIGDSEVDIQTAQNAEIPCISVAWGYKDIEFLYNNGAEVIIYSPDELFELI